MGTETKQDIVRVIQELQPIADRAVHTEEFEVFYKDKIVSAIAGLFESMPRSYEALFGNGEGTCVARNLIGCLYDFLVHDYSKGSQREIQDHKMLETTRTQNFLQNASDYLLSKRDRLISVGGNQGISAEALANIISAPEGGFFFYMDRYVYEDHPLHFRNISNDTQISARTYLTVIPESADSCYKEFIDICEILKKAGLRFEAKMTSPKATSGRRSTPHEKRLDNMVFYFTSEEDREKFQNILSKDTDLIQILDPIRKMVSTQEDNTIPGVAFGVELYDKRFVNLFNQIVHTQSDSISYNMFIAMLSSATVLQILSNDARVPIDQRNKLDIEHARVVDSINAVVSS